MNNNYRSITTWKDICKTEGIGPVHKIDLSSVPASLRPLTIASIRVAMIVKAINGDWVPDWNDSNQRKWWGWFWMNKPGFRFDGALYVISLTYATGGSRLCCETREQFEHIVKYFLPELKALYTA